MKIIFIVILYDCFCEIKLKLNIIHKKNIILIFNLINKNWNKFETQIISENIEKIILDSCINENNKNEMFIVTLIVYFRIIINHKKFNIKNLIIFGLN